MTPSYPPGDNYPIPDEAHEGFDTSYSESEAETDDSMFDQSDTSVHTMSTIRSDQVAAYFQSICGIPYESDESVPRIFPSNLSLEKLDIISHVIFRLLRGGINVPSRVDQVLRSGGVNQNQEPPRILEIVTNSGIWQVSCNRSNPNSQNAFRAKEMAGIYPSVMLTSLDTKPLAPHSPHARIVYEVYDFYAGILEPDSSFDVVYTKQGVKVVSAILISTTYDMLSVTTPDLSQANPQTKDFNFMLRELHRVLKPNGFLLMDILPVRVYEGADANVPVHSATYMAEGARYTRELWESQGVDTATWDDLASRLDPSHPHWENDQLAEPHPQNGPIRGFRSIGLTVKIVPFGAWSEDERERIIGGLMQKWVEIVWRNHLPIMLAGGMEEDKARDFIDAFLAELSVVDEFKIYCEFQLVCAQRI